MQTISAYIADDDIVYNTCHGADKSFVGVSAQERYSVHESKSIYQSINHTEKKQEWWLEPRVRSHDTQLQNDVISP